MRLFLTLALSALSAHAAGEPTLAAFALPTRQPLPAPVRTVGAALARRLGARLISLDEGAELTARLERAHALADRGALDEAAVTYDAALEQVARAPQSSGAGPAIVTATVERVSIALARGESRRAQELLVRLFDYDPGFTLVGNEESPRMRRAVGEAKKSAAASLSVARVADGCRAADIVLVARATGTGAEYVRFDRCQIVAATQAGVDSSSDEIAGRLALREAALTTPPRRKVAWAPWTLAGVGLAVAVTGAVLAGLGKTELDRLDRSACGMSETCDPAIYRDWETRQNAGWGLLGVGGALLAAGTIWGAVDLKKKR